MFCLDKAFGFMYDKENLEAAAQWILSGHVQIYGESLDTELSAE